MIQMSHELNLTKRTLGIHVIIKSVRYFLYRNELIRLRIQHRASNFETKTKSISLQHAKTNRIEIESTKENKIKQARSEQVPNDAVRATTNRHDRRPILGRDFKQVSKYIVLYKLTAVHRYRRKISRLTYAVDLRHVSHFYSLSSSLQFLRFCLCLRKDGLNVLMLIYIYIINKK